MHNIKILGIASGIGAETRGSELGVWSLYYSFSQIDLYFNKIIYSDDNASKLEAVKTWKYITEETQEFININELDSKYLFITGDHSNGFCVWNGLLNRHKGSVGLIWIDAHLDAHTSESSDSKNIHGMSISHLLGYGDTEVNIYNKYALNPKNLCFIGTRDYEKAELDFLTKRGVKIFFMKDITDKNIEKIIKKAIIYVSKNVDNFGISIDLDGFNPIEVPGTGCFCPNGLSVKRVSDSLKNIYKNSKFIGLEITEFNPAKDINDKTKKAIFTIVKSSLGI